MLYRIEPALPVYFDVTIEAESEADARQKLFERFADGTYNFGLVVKMVEDSTPYDPYYALLASSSIVLDDGRED